MVASSPDSDGIVSWQWWHHVLTVVAPSPDSSGTASIQMEEYQFGVTVAALPWRDEMPEPEGYIDVRVTFDGEVFDYHTISLPALIRSATKDLWTSNLCSGRPPFLYLK